MLLIIFSLFYGECPDFSLSISCVILQVRPLSSGMSVGGQDKAQEKRVELWTKVVIDYLQCILDECCQNDGTVSTLYNEMQQMLLGSSGQHQLTG